MIKTLKSLVFGAALLPLLFLIYGLLTDNLGANPIEKMEHLTGLWALIFLMLTLSITPLRRLTGLNKLIRFRRMLGLFVFFYALLHFSIYLSLDRYFIWPDIRKDLTKRPYIIVGFSALLMLAPLALTSTKKSIRRLGKKWTKLHRLIYPIALLAILHFWWLIKADVFYPALFAVIFALLMAFRWIRVFPKKTRQKIKNKAKGKR